MNYAAGNLLDASESKKKNKTGMTPKLLYLFPNYSLLPKYSKGMHLKHHSKGTTHGKKGGFFF